MTALLIDERDGGTAGTLPAQTIFYNQLCTAQSLLTCMTLIHHLNKKEEENSLKLTGTFQVSQSMNNEPTCSRVSLWKGSTEGVGSKKYLCLGK